MSDRIFAATRKGLFTIERRGGGRWEVSATEFLGDNLSLISVDPRDGTLYAAQDLGHYGTKFQRSDDGGGSFTEVGKPTYPEKPEGLEDRDAAGKEVPWNCEKIWAFAAGGDDEPGALWCGTIPGGLFRSNDRGDNWTLVESLWNEPRRKQWFGGGADMPGIHSICVDPRDSKHVALGISCGGVWVTRDRGETWDCRADGMRAAYMPPEQAFDPVIQDPHCVVQCRSAPDVLWAQHHNGIFRTTNGCEQWTEIESAQPSSFGFAVAVHPNDPDTAWFVPAIKDEARYPVDGQVVVTRTRDGGKSFEVLREGLPQQHAYDLTFRHALDVDGDGERLVFGTTTGSLWVSEDQGDQWHPVSHHLPPIHSVTFA